jgi:hypothetical protein
LLIFLPEQIIAEFIPSEFFPGELLKNSLDSRPKTKLKHVPHLRSTARKPSGAAPCAAHSRAAGSSVIIASTPGSDQAVSILGCVLGVGEGVLKRRQGVLRPHSGSAAVAVDQ